MPIIKPAEFFARDLPSGAFGRFFGLGDASEGESVFASITPAGGDLVTADANGYELGTRFGFAVAGTVTALRFYRPAGDVGDRTMRLWQVTGEVELAEVTLPLGDGSAGWKEVALAVAVNTGEDYIVAVSKAAGTDQDYYATIGHFTGQSYASAGGNVTSPAGAGLGNGIFTQTPGAIPESAFNDTFYWTDLAFAPD